LIDLKYHIASLVAVFLALGIGIFIGTTMIGSDVILKQQERLVLSLQEKFDSLRAENQKAAETIAELEAERALQEEFNRLVFPLLVQGRLQGRSMALINTYGKEEHEFLVNVLRMAGANVKSLTVVNLALFENPELCQEMTQILGLEGDSEKDSLMEALAARLSLALISGGDQELVKFLEEKGMLKISGSYGSPVEDVVLIGGRVNKDDVSIKFFDLVLVRTLKNNGVKVFGVEDTKVPVSCMRYYQSVQIPTVDNIDTIYGQFALIRALEGFPGNYGVKKTADSFLPPLS